MSGTRASIVAEATRQLTRVGGYAEFTVASVRDALGLSSGSMFHAFPSKPALAAAIYVDGMADYQRAATVAIGGAIDPASSLEAWIAAHLGWIEDHKDLARFLFSTQPREVMAEASRPLAAHNHTFYAALTSLFERAADARLMAHLPRPIAHAICIGPAQEYGRQWTRGKATPPPRQVAGTLQRATLAALAATLPPRARSRTIKESRP